MRSFSENRIQDADRRYLHLSTSYTDSSNHSLWQADSSTVDCGASDSSGQSSVTQVNEYPSVNVNSQHVTVSVVELESATLSSFTEVTDLPDYSPLNVDDASSRMQPGLWNICSENN